MILKKRQVLTATLIIALCAAITVNWYFTKPESSSDSLTTTKTENVVTGNLGDSLFVAGTTIASADKEEELTEDISQANATTTDDTDDTDAQNPEKYFSSAKLKRKNSYDETVDNIKEIISQGNLDKSALSEISVMLSDYEDDMKAQTDAENLITAKTGSECLVVINKDSCQVILEKNTLTNPVILQITEIIEKNTNIFSENLTIIELK